MGEGVLYPVPSLGLAGFLTSEKTILLSLVFCFLEWKYLLTIFLPEVLSFWPVLLPHSLSLFFAFAFWNSGNNVFEGTLGTQNVLYINTKKDCQSCMCAFLCELSLDW